MPRVWWSDTILCVYRLTNHKFIVSYDLQAWSEGAMIVYSSTPSNSLQQKCLQFEQRFTECTTLHFFFYKILVSVLASQLHALKLHWNLKVDLYLWICPSYHPHPRKILAYQIRACTWTSGLWTTKSKFLCWSCWFFMGTCWIVLGRM